MEFKTEYKVGDTVPVQVTTYQYGSGTITQVRVFASQDKTAEIEYYLDARARFRATVQGKEIVEFTEYKVFRKEEELEEAIRLYAVCKKEIEDGYAKLGKELDKEDKPYFIFARMRLKKAKLEKIAEEKATIERQAQTATRLRELGKSKETV